MSKSILSRINLNDSKSTFNYTKNNHYQFGYNNKNFINSTVSEDKFFIKYGFCERLPLDFRSECLIAAREIWKLKDDHTQLYLCLSGGIDSEIMAEAFRFARIPFEAVIHVYIDKNHQTLNHHDYRWAESYCMQHSIKVNYLKTPIFNFFESDEFNKMMLQTQCTYPMLAPTMKLMKYIVEELNGIPVIGSGEPLVEFRKTVWMQIESEPITSLNKYLIFNNLKGIPGFFQWSPELLYSFLIDKKIIDRIKADNVSANNLDLRPYDFNKIKSHIFKNYFNFSERPKYRGSENFFEIEEVYLNRYKYNTYSQQAYAGYEYFSLMNNYFLNQIKNDIKSHSVYKTERIRNA